MRRSAASALFLAFVATPSWAQSFDATLSTTSFGVERLSALPRLSLNSPIIAVRVIEYTEPRGSRARQRGIIVGQDITSILSVGLGFLEMKPRRSTLSPDPQLDGSSRRSRKAAILFTLKF
jgi:hypothetical protein